ncbi:NAD(P)/FAD-dependent oxidoreductase [Marinobacter sp.]|uniref:NAD(P)/FAD-dependent oxidoreductase n=1 Tax=Marinobacter sp. TaxID=50741 RepID=UPI0034A33EC6
MNNRKFQYPDVRQVAVVGSGVAGLCTARLLMEQGASVTLFEKSRGPGGRLAAKRVTGGSADMGAQYFTIRSPAFQDFLARFAGEGSFARWDARLGFQAPDGHWQTFPHEPRYVGVPRMTAISRALSDGLDIRAQTRITTMARNDRCWTLTDTDGQDFGPFDEVVITAPPAQTRDLLADSNLAALAEHLRGPVSAILPCWAVAAYFNEPPYSEFDGMRPNDEILYWVANNTSKPGRSEQGQWWVLHATPDWSAANENTPPDAVVDAMVAAFRALTGTASEPLETLAHRWLYARSVGSDASGKPGCLWYPEEGVGLAGDWLSGGRVEGAYLSAEALVREMI